MPEPGIRVNELCGRLRHVLRVPEAAVDAVSRLEQIEYIEKPKEAVLSLVNGGEDSLLSFRGAAGNRGGAGGGLREMLAEQLCQPGRGCGLVPEACALTGQRRFWWR